MAVNIADDASWIAGLFDGCGTICCEIKRGKPRVRLMFGVPSLWAAEMQKRLGKHFFVTRTAAHRIDTKDQEIYEAAIRLVIARRTHVRKFLKVIDTFAITQSDRRALAARLVVYGPTVGKPWDNVELLHALEIASQLRSPSCVGRRERRIRDRELICRR